MSAPTELPLDVPAADAAEQAREMRETRLDDPPAPPPIAAEADEYDAVEQSLEVEEEDEDAYR
jgi:hypothetical protein